MNKLLPLLLFSLILSTQLSAQEVFTFEDAGIEEGTFWNGEDGSGGFTNGDLFLNNYYDYDFWLGGWAVSAYRDTITNSFGNLYGCIDYYGNNESNTFLVGQYTGTIDIEETKAIQGVYINNATFPYLVMRDGDPSGFSKKFGGDSGNDPDFFLLTIKGYLGGELKVDTVDFYLADYRSDNNEEDYIIRDWTYVDLSVLGEVDALSFSLDSSDKNDFGILTPAFYCVDDITFADPSNTEDIAFAEKLSVYPNPASSHLQIAMDWDGDKQIELMDIMGKVLGTWETKDHQLQIDLSAYPAALYNLKIRSGNNLHLERIVKN